MKPISLALVGGGGLLLLLALSRKRDDDTDDAGRTALPDEQPAPRTKAEADEAELRAMLGNWDPVVFSTVPFLLDPDRVYCAAFQLADDIKARLGLSLGPDDISDALLGVAAWRWLEVESMPPEGLRIPMQLNLYFAYGSPFKLTNITEVPDEVVGMWSRPSMPSDY